jgi:hypothetical protein
VAWRIEIDAALAGDERGLEEANAGASKVVREVDG